MRTFMLICEQIQKFVEAKLFLVQFLLLLQLCVDRSNFLYFEFGVCTNTAGRRTYCSADEVRVKTDTFAPELHQIGSGQSFRHD